LTPPRVGFWSPCLYRAGGTERWHQTLFTGLDPARIDNRGLAVLIPDDVDPVMAECLRQYAPVVSGIEAMRELAAEVDVLICWGLAGIPDFIADVEPRPRVLYVSHGDGSSTWGRSTCHAAAFGVDRFIGVSEAALAPVPDSHRETAVVMLNGVDASRLTPTLTRAEQRAAWGVPNHAKVVACIARISDEKDPKALARCVACLPPGWLGVHVGDGLDANDAMMDAFAVAQTRVFFPGMTDDVGSALAAIDVLLVPSKQEGFGLSAVEAWMAGVPVVSTPVGIMAEHPDWVETVPVGADGPTLAKAVEWASVKTAGDYTNYGAYEAIRHHANRMYGSAAFVDRWMNLITEEAKCPSAASV
jgi:glycosyltransferase involved in cell wall biosynthesis